MTEDNPILAGWEYARYLDPDSGGGFRWYFEEDGRLSIDSHCCGDTFSAEQERALFEALLRKYRPEDIR